MSAARVSHPLIWTSGFLLMGNTRTSWREGCEAQCCVENPLDRSEPSRTFSHSVSRRNSACRRRKAGRAQIIGDLVRRGSEALHILDHGPILGPRHYRVVSTSTQADLIWSYALFYSCKNLHCSSPMREGMPPRSSEIPLNRLVTIEQRSRLTEGKEATGCGRRGATEVAGWSLCAMTPGRD